MRMLVRVLSPGRTGTRFIADLFSKLGFLAYHEDLYVGEPWSAVTEYLRLLGDLWRENADSYFELRSDFARPYVRSVTEALSRSNAVARLGLRRAVPWMVSRLISPRRCGIVLDAANALTPGTPLIHHECGVTDVEAKYIILVRNPLKTVHAIYQIERRASFAPRPRSFAVGADDVERAANVWKFTYELIRDQRLRLGEERFFTLELERFNRDLSYAAQLFGFIGVEFHPALVRAFVERVTSAPLRSQKIAVRSAYARSRNSDLYADPEFSFSIRELERILGVLRDTLEAYGIAIEACISEYLEFHRSEKERLGFE